MSQLFGVGVPVISKHLKNIIDEGELRQDTTVSKMETVVNFIALAIILMWSIF